MIKNYLLVFWRSLLRQKLFSFINIAGLSLAIAFALLSYLYIKDEYSFDRFHQGAERIYRINVRSFDNLALLRGDEDPYRYSAYLPNALGDAIRQAAPEVERVTLIKWSGSLPVNADDKPQTEDVTYADSDFFNVFSFTIVDGTTQNLLAEPTQAVITPAVATKLFGDEDPIGKTLSLDSDNLTNPSFVVQAVVDCPANSSVQFKILLPLNAYKPYASLSWNVNSYPVFVKLKTENSALQLKTTLGSFTKAYRADWMSAVREYFKLSPDMLVEEYTLTALHDVHFDKKVSWPKMSNAQYSLILAGVALLILTIAGINYISFALVQSATRRKEIGVRKTIGASGGQLFRQFNIESMGYCLLATVVGVFLATLLLPLFNSFAQKEISLLRTDIGWAVAFLMTVVLVVGFFAGSYPSIFVSRIKPVLALKGDATRQPIFVKPLIVLQFALSAFLMISAIMMYRQMKFIATKDLGFRSDNVISVPTNSGWGPQSDRVIERYRNSTRGSSSVMDVSGTSGSFIRGGMSMTFKHEGHEKEVYICRVDERYLSLLNIPLLQGRNFQAGLPADSSAILVNEALVEAMGWTNPVGEVLKLNDRDPGYSVIGVMKNYHFLSLEEEIKPLFLTGTAKSGSYQITLLAKLDGSNLPESLRAAETAWRKLYPDKPFEYTFADDELARQYSSYQRWMNMSGVATTMAMLIAAMGLFGLSGIYSLRRTKEMSIRKIMGAQSSDLFFLLNRPFLQMSLYAFVIAFPFSVYVMKIWMANFTFHTEVDWWLFVICFVLLSMVTLTTISYHSLKLVKVNPADTLKYE